MVTRMLRLCSLLAFVGSEAVPSAGEYGTYTIQRRATYQPLSHTVWSSNKGKWNEPEVAQPLTISENVFELVMGLFENITHEKTKFLHHVCRAIDFILIVG